MKTNLAFSAQKKKTRIQCKADLPDIVQEMYSQKKLICLLRIKRNIVAENGKSGSST